MNPKMPAGFYEVVQQSKYPTMRANLSSNLPLTASVSSIYSDNAIDGGGELHVYEVDRPNMKRYLLSSCMFHFDDGSRRIPTHVPIFKAALLDALDCNRLTNITPVGGILLDGAPIDGWRHFFFRRRPPMAFGRDTDGLKAYIAREHRGDLLVDGRLLGYLIHSDALESLRRANLQLPSKPRLVIPL